MLIALALAVSALATGGPAQGHTKAYFNTLTIQFRGSATGDSFNGRVNSAKPVCERGRKVVVWRIQPGSYARIGADFTASDGKWELDPPGQFLSPGDYYATMKRKALRRGDGHNHSCPPVTTPPVSVGR